MSVIYISENDLFQNQTKINMYKPNSRSKSVEFIKALFLLQASALAF